MAEPIEKRRQARQKVSGLPVSTATAVINVLAVRLDQLEK
jgi:hypothetical protein